ncbi:MAG: hypothetical protein LBD52_00730, partial [Prevotellaceae bacterium]|nr:hypothetical protein [Prevotellaceae bacterium]
MNDKALLIALGFNPKEGAVGVLTKKYQQADGYRWNKLTKGSGVFDEWAKPYNFEIKKFTKDNLRELTEVEGQSLFNKFAIILRKHSVSDKPNAFNKIFNLFLAKLYDEQKKQTDELEFHWRDDDNPVDFQVRLFNLHKEGLRAFLEKELAGIYDSDFEGVKSREELLAKKKKVRIERKWDNVEFSRIATITRGVTYSKSDQQLEPTENIVLT